MQPVAKNRMSVSLTAFFNLKSNTRIVNSKLLNDMYMYFFCGNPEKAEQNKMVSNYLVRCPGLFDVKSLAGLTGYTFWVWDVG